jgi:hypothetical protein
MTVSEKPGERVLCSECFDLECPEANFQLRPQAECSRCGRKCLGYVEKPVVPKT